MKITRFGFGRLRFGLAFGLCLSLILSTFLQSALTAQRSGRAVAGVQEKGDARKVSPVPPRTRPPAANLPNLDQVRHAQPAPVRAAEPIPSTMRSRHDPLQSREGRRVSDRVPGRRRSHHGRGLSKQALSAMTATMPVTLTFSDDPLTAGVPIQAIHFTELRDAIDQARSRAGLSTGGWAEAITSGAEVRATHITEMRTRLDAARQALGYSTGGYTDPNLGAGYWIKKDHVQELRDRVREVLDNTSSDQYVANFLQRSLGRPPTGPESAYWTDIIRAAYPLGLSAMQLAMRELGMTVFESAEYAARNRNDHWYVYDLYKTFLMRDPDTEGWAHWEAAVPVIGREQVRRAFDESTEFANIVAELNASGSPSATVTSLATARVDSFNQSGNQLQSRGAEWGVSLVSLPGRAGLDLGLGLSYSSLVWTNSGPYAYFDADKASLSPGFHIGFPTIQDKFFDARVGKNVYLLTTAAGSRVELRQVGTSNVYESADSSYLQLISNGSLLLRTTAGMSMTYSWTGTNEYRCTSIQDSNGNYMLVNYDWRGDIQNVTDTLGRVITFNYDTNANLNSITQSWNGQTHTWASFGWDNLTMQPTMTGIVGTHGGEVMPVLKMVAFDDATYTKFIYNGNGQVERITHYASDSNPATDNHPRNYTDFDYDSPTNDCPRLTARRVWAEYWTGFNDVPGEVTTQFGVEGEKHTVTVLGDPNGTIYKETYAGSADPSWMRGLVKSSEVLAGGVQQKLSTIVWTQDNTNLNYKSNPRVIETNVYDSVGNRRRVTVDFSVAVYAQYGLPYIVREYAGDATTILRETYTDYKLDQAYLDRRIIGLVAAVHLVSNGYQAKVTYGYDDPARLTSQATNATMHDQYYNANFHVRGNVTSVSRWDVMDMNTIVDPSRALTTFMNYNAVGSVISSTDPAQHTSQLSYADSFSDGNNGRNTFAYPTTLTDADGFSSVAQYHFDFGAKTRLQGPPPQNQPNGIIQTFAYDNAARIDRVTTVNNGAYTRYVYGSYWVQKFSTVNTVADEAYSMTTFDGVGRGFTTTSNHPGSAGGYKLVNTIFDRMGRPVLQSNPTEVNSSWLPAGDDAVGVRYSVLDFDWQGRTTRTTHPDGHYKEASYAGCGCAGGEAVTLTDEVGRRQKVYKDVLGRQWKTEVLNWDGTVYSTARNTFNARDQVTLVRQFAGTDQSSTYQDTTMSYDGYGRLQTKHVPEENAGTMTTWTYKPDDAIETVTDARGATANYIYNNNRHLVNEIHYNAPSGVAPTPNVTYGYDAVGNRTSMTDGLGSQSYGYDSLSRVTSETRHFSEFAGNSMSGNYTLSYQYNLANQVTSLNDPFGGQVLNQYDSSGRLSSLNSSGYVGSYYNFATNQVVSAPLSTLISDVQYRASGAVKQTTYGNGVSETTNFDSRMQPTNFNVNNVRLNCGAGLSCTTASATLTWNLDYHSDGRIHHAYDQNNPKFDRRFDYDQAARIKEFYTNREARGQTPDPFSDKDPSRQTIQYDAFNHITSRVGHLWNVAQSDEASYTNNRRQYWGYDASGNPLSDSANTHTYDGLSRQTHVSSIETVGDGSPTYPVVPGLEITQSYDADGGAAKRRQIVRTEFRDENQNLTSVSATDETTHYVRSTVLGGAVISELELGSKKRTNIYANGRLVAKDGNYWNTIDYQHAIPATGSWISTGGHPDDRLAQRHERDPLGAELPLFAPIVLSYPSFADEAQPFLLGGDPFDLGSGCTLDGMPISCSELQNRMESGTVEAEFPDIWINGRNGRVTARQPIISYGVGLFGVYLPDGSRGNDVQWDLHLFSFRNDRLTSSRSHHAAPRAQAQQRTPCDVQVPDDERTRIMLGVVLEETTPMTYANGVFSFDQFTKDANNRDMINFSGDAAVQEVKNEIYYMVSALLNQLAEGRYGGVLEDIARGESVAYAEHGQRRNSQINDYDDYCLKARLLLDVLNYIDRHGTARFHNGNPVRYWRGVGQGGGKRNFRQGDQRAGNSDFMYLPPQVRGRPNPDYRRLPYWINGRWSW